MRPCPGCEYIVPAAWTECKRCGAELTGGAAMAFRPEPALVAAAAPASPSLYRPAPTPAAPMAAAPFAAASMPPAPPMPPARPVPVATFQSAPPMRVADLRPTDRGDGRGAGARGHGGSGRRGHRSSVGALVAVLIIGVCGYLAWDKIAHPPVPVELKPWLLQGQGVTYAPEGSGLSVSLPASPAERSGQITVGRGTIVGDRVSVATVGSHSVGVAWFNAPQSALNDDTDGPAHAAAVMATQAIGASLDVAVHASSHGMPAINAEISVGKAEGDAFVVLDGTRVVIVYVVGIDHGTAGYDHLRHSLQLS